MLKLSNETLEDFLRANGVREADIVPMRDSVIRGEVVSDHAYYRVKRRLTHMQKFSLWLAATFALGVILPVLLLPWILKFAWLVMLYVVVFSISKWDSLGGSGPSVGRPRVPGKAIVPFH
jgi:hypothetical protein